MEQKTSYVEKTIMLKAFEAIFYGLRSYWLTVFEDFLELEDCLGSDEITLTIQTKLLSGQWQVKSCILMSGLASPFRFWRL
jgi:hypothetical protein